MIALIHEFMQQPLFVLCLIGGTFLLGQRLHQWKPWPIFNPLIFSIMTIIAFLLITNTDYAAFEPHSRIVSLWVTPATVALAIKLEENFDYLRRNYLAILTGIVSGVLIHTMLIFVLVWGLGLDGQMAATLYPKSITTAIAMDTSLAIGGIASLTVAVVVVTGIVGQVVAPTIFRWFKIEDAVAQGVALGSAAHAMGTSHAIKMGSVQGAMAGLSIVVTGITVVLLSPLAQYLITILF